MGGPTTRELEPMAFLTTEPQALTAAAAEVNGISSAISAASTAATGPTSGLLAPAADEVSETVADLFRLYSQQYQAAIRRGGQLYNEFAHALAAAENGYAAAEADARALLGIGGAPAGNPVFSPITDPHFNAAIVIGGSGNPIPNQTYVDGVLKWATQGGFTWPANNVQTLFTPEGLYPLTGVRSLTLSASVGQGVQILDQAIKQQIATNGSVLVQGYSQSAIISSLEMRNLLNPALNPTPPSSTQLGFNLIGDIMNPNGGLLARFPGLNLPSLGLDFYGATPANTPWTTNIYTLEYDGFADFPRYPIDVFSDVNALAGIVFVHGMYPHLDPSTTTILPLPTSSDYTGSLANTHYWIALTPNLPLLDPLRYIPVVGNPLADLLQPDMRVLVNLGYGDPNYGYSTSPANVPTPFGLFPHVSPGVVATGLLSGTQQGISAATGDLMAEGSGISLAGIQHSLSSIALPSPGTMPSTWSINGLIQSLETANNNFAGGFSKALSDGYAVLLPTADIANAAIISIPSYDIDLFLNGIGQAANGDPLGLINAIGDPLAADTGLITVAGGVEGLVLVSGAVAVLKDFASI
jgi:PE-PPE domain/PE family